MNTMHKANNTMEHPRLTFIPQVAMIAVNSAKPITFNCLLHASRLSHRAQIANTFNSLSVASREFPPVIKIGIVA